MCQHISYSAMNEEYYQLTAELDAREVLRYLNNLGIHNISGEVLKYFITDLKKFIKYDLQQKYNKSNEEENVHIYGPERLHSASTFSSRVRSRASEGTELKCSRDCLTRRRNLHVRNTHSAPNVRQEVPEEKPLRRACSCVRVEKKDSITNQPKPSTTTTTLNKNIIKVPQQPVRKKCDPVTLYHYYTSLWEKYKSNVPGENNWSDLRWSVRQKMAGCKEAPIKVSEAASQQKTVNK